MVKNIFSNLSRGFFYSIGKTLAIIAIGILIVFIVNKIAPKEKKPNYNTQWVYRFGDKS